MKFRWILVLTLLVTIGLTSCSSLYHRPWRTNAPEVSESGTVTLRFLEVDDEGWFWDRRQADAIIDGIHSSVKTKDTMVVTFVHGWHHCARCCDENVEGFRQTLVDLSKTLEDRFNIIGIFVGWRGQSLPMPANVATFWGRKGAAERIGENDIREFFSRLQRLFASYRPDVIGEPGSNQPQGPHHFLGLATIGHSFGAQIVLRSVASSIENQLMLLNQNPAYLRGARSADPKDTTPVSVSGFGDLVVLINPAVEASQYHRLHILSRGLNYSQLQTPLVLTVSAEDDYARHRLFKFGRMLGEFFTGKPRKDDPVQRAVERQALGVYEGHITHELGPVDTNVSLHTEVITNTDASCGNKTCSAKWLDWVQPPQTYAPDSLNAQDASIATFDFSGSVVFNDVRLRPLESAANGTSGFQPLIVARASNKIIESHSDIFSRPFIRFIVPYVTFIERKSRANLNSNRERREEQIKHTAAEEP
ncbi:MAG TPA: hypothetical protein VNA21_14210 [Steroidobacteraceae bacterium]|nr:hypothetical protein [Steroidobacteraceae bacterium]